MHFSKLSQLLLAAAISPAATLGTETSSETSKVVARAPPLCPSAPAPLYPLNTLSKYTAGVVVGGLTTPRGIAFDSSGNLLVVDRGVGVLGYVLSADGCVASTTTVLADTSLNHGIALSLDGQTLFVSSADALWSYSYNAATLTVSDQKVIINGMGNDGYFTRTILSSKKHPNLLVVNRGAVGNIDLESYNPSVMRANVKVFDWTTAPTGGWNWTSQGSLLAYGLRNEVGITEDKAGGVWGVENSSNSGYRVYGTTVTDVSLDNPAEKLNYLGHPSNPSGDWYGYPYCYTVWEPSAFPSEQLKTGQWFSQNQTEVVNNQAMTDAYCESAAVKPEIAFQGHVAPLDIKFGASDSNAYVALHGSFSRIPPTGYSVVVVPGKYNYAGKWSAAYPLKSQDGYSDFLWNTDINACTNTVGCFRPVGLAFHPTTKHLYVSSDTSGEIFIVKKKNIW